MGDGNLEQHQVPGKAVWICQIRKSNGINMENRQEKWHMHVFYIMNVSKRLPGSNSPRTAYLRARPLNMEGWAATMGTLKSTWGTLM